MAKKNSAGKYRGRVQIGVDKDGKPINKYVCAATLRELEEKKEQTRRYYIEGEPVAEDVLFYQFAENWYKLKKEPYISLSSRNAYVTMFKKYILPSFGLRHLRAITANELQLFANSFKATSKSQITMMIGILKNIMREAYAEGLISRDPSVALKRPKAKEKNERRALTQKETAAVLKTIGRHPDGLLLAVLYYMGLRRGEALGLKWGDFDFDENLVHIQRDIDFAGSTAQDGELKTKAANRYVPIFEELQKMLVKVRGAPDQYVFHTEKGNPLSLSTFTRKWLSLMEDCGCAQEREVFDDTDRPTDIRKRLRATISPHYLRHNFVSLLYEANVDPLVAMKIVGHADYQTTANIYTHLSEETMRKANISLGDVFKKKEEAVKPEKEKPPKGSKEARSRKPPVDESLPWAHSF